MFAPCFDWKLSESKDKGSELLFTRELTFKC